MRVARAADRLRDVPLFAGIPEEHLERLAAQTSPHRLDAGEWLFREGDPGDSLYVVAAGSVDVVAEGPSPVVIRRLTRGDSVGEIALLSGGTRSAGIRAHRDAELIRLDRDDFARTLLEEPAFGVALLRVLGERLGAVRSPVGPQVSPPRTIALVPLHPGAPLAAVADGLVASLAALGDLARLDAGAEVTLESLDRVEEAHERVLLVAANPPGDDPWTTFCLHQADRVVALAARPPGAGDRPPPVHLIGCDLAFSAPTALEPDLAAWMDRLTPRTTHILRAGAGAGIDRMARRLAGRSLGVVLSGGGARGLAHIGVVEELERAGLVIDRIGGASMGAMVGSLFAEGRSAEETAALIHEEYVVNSPLRGRTVPLVSLSRGAIGFARQHQLHGTRCIEGLDVDFFCVSSDLAAQRLVVHRRGLVAVAVSASQALPAFVPPVRDGDRICVDGAVLNNLPVGPMRATGEGPVIAVDVSGRLPAPRAPHSRLPWLRRWIVGPAVEWAPPITETVLRSILLGASATDAAAREAADVVIQPTLRGVSTMRFRDIEGPRRAGREAVRAAIDSGELAALAMPRRS